MRLTHPRRTFLAGMGSVGIAGVAGCVDGPGSTRGATDVVVHNEAAVSRAVEVTVTRRGDGPPDIDTSLDMAAHSSRTINNEVLMDSNYDVAVTYTDGSSDAPYSETQAWTDAGQPLHVLLTEQVVFTVQVG